MATTNVSRTDWLIELLTPSQIPNPKSRIPALTPLPVAAAIGVPLRRRLEVAGFEQVLFDDLFVERDAEAGLVGHGDVTLVDDRFLDAVYQVAPPRHVHGMILQRQEVLGGGGAVHVRHAG